MKNVASPYLRAKSATDIFISSKIDWKRVDDIADHEYKAKINFKKKSPTATAAAAGGGKTAKAGVAVAAA